MTELNSDRIDDLPNSNIQSLPLPSATELVQIRDQSALIPTATTFVGSTAAVAQTAALGTVHKSTEQGVREFPDVCGRMALSGSRVSPETLPSTPALTIHHVKQRTYFHSSNASNVVASSIASKVNAPLGSDLHTIPAQLDPDGIQSREQTPAISHAASIPSIAAYTTTRSANPEGQNSVRPNSSSTDDVTANNMAPVHPERDGEPAVHAQVVDKTSRDEPLPASTTTLSRGQIPSQPPALHGGSLRTLSLQLDAIGLAPLDIQLAITSDKLSVRMETSVSRMVDVLDASAPELERALLAADPDLEAASIVVAGKSPTPGNTQEPILPHAGTQAPASQNHPNGAQQHGRRPQGAKQASGPETTDPGHDHTSDRTQQAGLYL